MNSLIIGFKYVYPESANFIEYFGEPETLNGTNNIYWVAYFPKGNFTILLYKKQNIIIDVFEGKQPNIKPGRYT